jgi:hypothetical protein
MSEQTTTDTNKTDVDRKAEAEAERMPLGGERSTSDA